MAISLKKGEGINLSKEVGELKHVTVGLGWSASTTGMTIDCDSFVYILREDKIKEGKGGGFLAKLFGKEGVPETRLRIMSNSDIIYYANLSDRFGCVKHHGDDLVGGSKGDCEQISINLAQMPNDVKGLVVGINIYSAYSKGQDFGKVKNCFGRIYDDDTKREICHYNLSDGYDGYTAVIVGQFLKKDDGWHFEASGEGKKVSDIRELAREYM